MATLTLIRGLPGSGKSTFAQVLIEQQGFPHRNYGVPLPIHLEADMYFTKDGDYKFVSEEIPIAHKVCRMACDALLALNRSVIVANTFTRCKEMEPYINAATSNGLDVAIYEMKGSYGSIHNVPPEALERMAKRWETLPADWLQYLKEL